MLNVRWSGVIIGTKLDRFMMSTPSPEPPCPVRRNCGEEVGEHNVGVGRVATVGGFRGGCSVVCVDGICPSCKGKVAD